MKKLNIQLEELVCPMCGSKIEKALMKEKGVISAAVSYNSSKAKISYEEKEIEKERIISVITGLGYEVIGVK